MARFVLGGTVVRVAAVAVVCIVVAASGAVAQGGQRDTREIIIASDEDQYGRLIAEAAQRFGVPATWIRLIMQAESAGIAAATSPAGAMGLMQLMPDTYAAMRARHGLGSDPYDPRDSILAGAALLRDLFDCYGAPGFLAAYNAGPARYEQYLSQGRPLPAETLTFVAALAPAISGTLPDDPIAGTADAPPAPAEAPIFVARGGVRPTGGPGAVAGPVDRETSALFAARRPIDRKPAAVTDDDRQAAEAPARGQPRAASVGVTRPDARLFVPATRKEPHR